MNAKEKVKFELEAVKGKFEGVMWNVDKERYLRELKEY